MTDPAWERAALALRLLALDPGGLGGAVIRMRASPDRDVLLQAAKSSLDLRKLPISITDEQLFGGSDLAASLAAGRLVKGSGVLAEGRSLLMPMAERCPTALAARLAQHLDATDHACLLAVDEGADDEERCPRVLSDRLSFHIACEGRAPFEFCAETSKNLPETATIEPDQIEALVVMAARLGIDSLRPPIFAVAAAQAHARLHNRRRVTEDDLSAAAALTLAHHATQLPSDEQEDNTPAPPEPSTSDAENGSDTSETALDDILVEAVAAALPQGLLTRAALQNSKGTSGSGAGSKQKGQKGRPLPPRQMAQSRNRIDLIATLRAAAPWQTVRRKARGTDRLVILKTDLRHKRHEDRSDRLLIFTVDASGSSAMARLAETKGAIELLLAEAYASRDHVALVAFRGEGADVLLPPTRSLVQTKRRLAALPGGGGTPLAAGLFEAGRLAHQSRGRGLAPTLILLTDGRANIALDGTGKRSEAQRDAQEVATTLRHAGTRGLVIDTGRRPSSDLAQLSDTLDSPYVPLPHANAHSLQETVATALGR